MIDLFCLPFAGGNKYSYREYRDKAPSFVNIIPLDYPGRGGRMNELLLSDMDRLVNDLYDHVKRTVKEKRYAIYGHSMGGVVAFLLARKLIAENHMPPLHLFISGTSAPAASSRKEIQRHLLEKDAFIEEIKRLDGCPEEVLQNKELLDFLEPILRADFRVIETYNYEQAAPLAIPVTIITGEAEDMEEEDIRLWQDETTCPVDFRKMPGKHFFIFDCAREIAQIFAEKLS